METPHIKTKREELELLGFRSDWFSAGACRTWCMCPRAHEGSGNAAELEEQPLRPLLLLLPPSSVFGGPAPGGTDPLG